MNEQAKTLAAKLGLEYAKASCASSRALILSLISRARVGNGWAAGSMMTIFRLSQEEGRMDGRDLLGSER